MSSWKEWFVHVTDKFYTPIQYLMSRKSGEISEYRNLCISTKTTVVFSDSSNVALNKIWYKCAITVLYMTANA